MASAYERKGSPYFWIKIRQADGSWKSESTGIRKDQPGAERKLQQRLAKEVAREKRFKGDKGVVMLRAWVPDWVARHYVNPKSAQRAMNAWAHLSAYFKLRRVHHPEEVTYTLIHDYMKWRSDPEVAEKENRRPANWNTALTEVRLLGTIMQEALARGWVTGNPCARLRLGRRNVKEKREILPDEQAEIERQLEQPGTPQWMRDCWLVGIKQGCRISEVKVPMDRIDEKNMVITFLVKGGRFHPAPLHRDLLPLVARRREERAEFLVDLPKYAPKLWIQWLVNRGFENLSFHCLRVTVITRLARAGFPEAKTMEYVGHCSELVHAIYRKLRPKDVADLGRAL